VPSWPLASRLVCPSCGYDVTQTFKDRFSICPECGREVSRELCESAASKLSTKARTLLVIVCVSPVVLIWPVLLQPGLVWILLLAYGAVYGGWVLVERRQRREGALLRAVVPLFGTVILNWILLVGLVILGCALVALFY
jgi:hypothetical protein